MRYATNTTPIVSAALALAIILVGCGIDTAPSEHSSGLGTVSFANSGHPDAQGPFIRGLSLLHSFEYEDAAVAFQEAQAIDSTFAMAYWGEALTYNHPLWAQQDLARAQAVLLKLGATAQERAGNAPTAREKDYLATLEALYFGEGTKQERDDAYAAAMAALAESYPDDDDAVSMYALALLGTSHEGRDTRIYMRAAAQAERVYDRNPAHPGAVHYLIHAYDDPDHAPLGLSAAHTYARIAPQANHALHMPSHIFLALGQWDNVITSNTDAWQAAVARAERLGKPIEERAPGYHALYWRSYAYLAAGDAERAGADVDTMAADIDRLPSRSVRSHYLRTRAAFVVDQVDPLTGVSSERATAMLAKTVASDDLGWSTPAVDDFAHAWAAIAAGYLATARSRATQIETTVSAQFDRASDHLVVPLDVMHHQLLGLISYKEGYPSQAEFHLKMAAQLEQTLPFDFGPPHPVKPANELAGEFLMMIGKTEEAAAFLRLARDRNPGRLPAST